eukprot:757955-Hanusia_phi.AAC.1
MSQTSRNLQNKLHFIILLLALYLSMPLIAMQTSSPTLLVNPMFGSNLSNIITLDLALRGKMRNGFINPNHYDVSVSSMLKTETRKTINYRKQFLVQTLRQNRSQIREQIEKVLGCKVYRYIPQDTYIVESNQMEMKQIRDIQGVIDITHVPPIMKLSSVFVERLLQAKPKVYVRRSQASGAFQGCTSPDPSCSTYTAQLAMSANLFLRGVEYAMNEMSDVARIREPAGDSSVVNAELPSDCN